MSVDLIDELEAGELSIEFEGEEPQVVLEWAFQTFGSKIALSTSFQADSVALIDMAYEIEPNVRVFSVDTGRLPAETHELAERLRDRYPLMNLEIISPNAEEVAAMVTKHGPNLFQKQVDLRLLCCNVRKVRPLTKHLHGLDAWVTGLRRDQWASRTNIRKVEIDHDQLGTQFKDIGTDEAELIGRGFEADVLQRIARRLGPHLREGDIGVGQSQADCVRVEFGGEG